MNRERSDKMEEEKKEKKGFFARLVSGLTRKEITLYPVLIMYFMDFHILMMISMKKSKRF